MPSDRLRLLAALAACGSDLGINLAHTEPVQALCLASAQRLSASPEWGDCVDVFVEAHHDGLRLATAVNHKPLVLPAERRREFVQIALGQ